MYIPDTQSDTAAMLEELGIGGVHELFSPIPNSIRLGRTLNIPEGISEFEVYDRMLTMSLKNRRFSTIFRGAGAYCHLIPSVVSKLGAREEFVTAYTPYQAEISQGVLQAMFEFQTMICNLTAMDASNASVYDGATAAVEAVYMSIARGKERVMVSEGVNPQIVEVLRTYGAGNIEMIPLENGATCPKKLAETISYDTCCVILQQPNFFGMMEDIEVLSEIAHTNGALSVVHVNPISLGMLKPPGESGADIAIGEGQPLGIPLSFGGPYLGFMACTEKLTRKLPGRIVGETIDKNGKRGYVLTLQAREQHIKRERAKSSICSNQALCAILAAIYLAAMGPHGLYETASQCTDKAHELYARITQIPGFMPVFTGDFFHEFVTKSPMPVSTVLKHLEKHDILGGLPLSNIPALPEDNSQNGYILWCATEANTHTQIDALINALREVAE